MKKWALAASVTVARARFAWAMVVVALQVISTSSPAQSLGDALNAPYLTWTTTGDVTWFGETNTSHDGVSAAQTGAITVGGQQSMLQTTVTGPGTLTFWWELGFSFPWNLLTFSINGVQQTSPSHLGTWQQQTFYLPPGVQTLLWDYKNITGRAGTGWVDQVSFSPGGTAPIVTVLPVNQTVPAGTNVTFSVKTGGTPPLVYAWQFKGTNILYATNSTLNLADVQPSNGGVYSVNITNAYGTTNVSAILAVNPSAPWIIIQPVSQALPLRCNAAFQTGVEGSEPLAYQWQFNGNNIVGASDSTWIVSRIKTNDVGTYQVIVTNSLGAVTSSPANLTLVSSAVIAWGNNSYGQTVPPPNLTNALAISAGGAHGMALKNDATVVGWGDNAMGQTNVPANLTNVVAVSGGEDFSLTLQSDGTITAWGWNIYGQTAVPIGLSNVVAISGGRYHALALRSDGSVVVWGQNTDGVTNVSTDLTNAVAVDAGVGHDLALRSDGTPVTWGLTSNGAGPTNVPAGLSNVVAVEAAQYHSVALKYDGTVVVWGSDSFGQTDMPQGLSNVIAISAGDLHTLALKSDGTVVGWGAGLTNDGSYTYSGQCLPPTALTNVVAISGGQAFSLALVNDGSPYIARQPLIKQVAVSGGNALLSVGAAGIAPLSYQWQFNGIDIPGATNAVMDLTSLPLTNGGNYQCVVTNLFGAVTSSPTTLLVQRSVPVLNVSAMSGGINTGYLVTLTGLSGHGNVTVFGSTNLTTWDVVFTNPPVLGTLQYLDTGATNVPWRFYRAVEQ